MIALVGFLGLVVGFLIGVVFDDALDLIRASRKERDMNRRTRVGRGALAAALAVAVLMQVTVGVLLILTRNTSANYAECTGRWQQSFSEGYQARLSDSIPVQNALDDLIRAVAAQDRETFKAALARYVKLRDAQERGRKANPLPPLPETLCGKPGGAG